MQVSQQPAPTGVFANQSLIGNLAGWNAVANTSTITVVGQNNIYFGGGSPNVGAEASQIVDLVAGQRWELRFNLRRVGSGGNSAIRVDIYDVASGITILSQTCPTTLVAIPGDPYALAFGSRGPTRFVFTDVSTGNMASQDTLLEYPLLVPLA